MVAISEAIELEQERIDEAMNKGGSSKPTKQGKPPGSGSVSKGSVLDLRNVSDDKFESSLSEYFGPAFER